MKSDVMEQSAARSQTSDKSGSGKPEINQQEMTKRMQEAGTPGAPHQALKGLEGNWKAEVKCWHEPGGSAQVSQGTAKAKMIFNGRFLEEEFHGEMMGKPFTGRTLLGYDNVKQSFKSVWISDTQTAIFTSEGKGDSANKVITLEGTASCPINGQVTMKSVLRVTSPDKHVFEMYDKSKGGENKVMEITYTRQ